MSAIRLLACLYQADTAADAARFAQALQCAASCGRVCVVLLASGKWAVYLYRG